MRGEALLFLLFAVVVVSVVGKLVEAISRMDEDRYYYWPAPMVVRSSRSPVGCGFLVVILIVILVAASSGEIIF
jgi:hypothetical protein